MESENLQQLIPPSESDRLLHAWGYDLVKEYFTVASELPASDVPVVELATGSGRMCAVLSTLFPVVITGDISIADRQRAITRIPDAYRSRVAFQQLDMEQLPFRDSSIERLICMNTLHETVNPERCLLEMIRVMHPEGNMIIGDFNETGFTVMQRIHETVYHNDHDRGSISSDRIRTLLTGCCRTLRTIDTPLNTTFIVTGKR